MDQVNSHQRAALEAALSLLEGAGLTPQDLESVYSPSRPTSSLSSRTSTPAVPGIPPSPAVIASRYIPPPARSFTADELARRLNRINKKQAADAIVYHPPGAIVEYPQTGSVNEQAVAHVFPVDPAGFVHPKASFQYSLGDNHGGRPGVMCSLLRDDAGNPIICNRLKTSCRGLKVCSARSREADSSAHSHTDRFHVGGLISPRSSHVDTAKAEIFTKTLALFCALQEHGCSSSVAIEYANPAGRGIYSDDSEPESDDENGGNPLPPGASSLVQHLSQSRRSRSDGNQTCNGALLLRRDRFHQHYISCQHQRRGDRSHLLLRNLQEYDIDYLRALLENDMNTVAIHENAALQGGYGPRVPCTFVASPSEQKQRCPFWHRYADGTLARGTLTQWGTKCLSTYHIYVPQDLSICPRVVVVCRSPHNHSPPAPVNTPPPLVDILDKLLSDMGWRLADATPRRVMLDSGFVRGLRAVLGWELELNPSLPDLHPSLANLDHLRRLIMRVRLLKFPDGTGFEAVRLLVSNSIEDVGRYVRCAETHLLSTGKEFQLVICMSASMSLRLMHATRISIDTSFKRVHGWQEFEIETWDNYHMRSIVSTRAFTTSQSAEAHFILFSRIFAIAKSDTGLSVKFHHIDGNGIQSVVADGHKGQGLGKSWNVLCLTMCYKHHVHFRRNLLKLRTSVNPSVYNAMLSIACTEPHPDFKHTLRIIQNGGKKAKAWLKEKIVDTKFALPALYYPESLMPLEFWQACPTTTNGNEQAHRSINRDGTNLTLLAGIMRGQEYDKRAATSINVHMEYGINSRDQPSTHNFRALRSVSRHGTPYHPSKKNPNSLESHYLTIQDISSIDQYS
ncbi:hypothetical protein EV363DRAFT_1298507 [Boletus edulis]|nr:hypothetical protein EV363DRAFT_1298507 [Boletus edulis]